MRVEHADTVLVRTAGEACTAVEGATTMDAIVMATAARRGGVVYTSGVDDPMALTRVFPSVRVLHC
jgi:hypothetical protein